MPAARLAASLACLPLVLAAAMAHAGDRPAAKNLPGVDLAPSARAVAPPPEPEPSLPAGAMPGSVRVGNWDLTISGSVSYEISTGAPPRGQ